GKTLVISVQNDREWASLVERVLGRPELANHPDFADNRGRMAHRTEVDTMVQRVFSTLTTDELIGMLREARIAYGAVNDLQGLSEHPQLRRWVVDSATGEVKLPAHPDAVRTQASMQKIPGLGEHSDAVRAEFDA
ncbi:MAG: CoA transferase, partial [Gammaproteobacteria bacterium]|nr:CoA transferase [Gammaproteobacteria bacterium]